MSANESWIPAFSQSPHMGTIRVARDGMTYELPYIARPGSGPAILFVHGLGGCKENFLLAMQSRALAHCSMVMFDTPGTGRARYFPEHGLDVTALADLTQQVADNLIPGEFVLAGASMGGLIAQLMMRRHGTDRIRAYVNIEGNLMSEDCMFSRRVIPHSLEELQDGVFAQMIEEMRRSSFAGDRIVASNLALNVDVRSYHAYSFQTVAESDSGKLLEEFLELPMPRLFLYGEANRHLSYLERLRNSDVQVVEVPDSGHFVFYDNPVAMFSAVGAFVNTYLLAAR